MVKPTRVAFTRLPRQNFRGNRIYIQDCHENNLIVVKLFHCYFEQSNNMFTNSNLN